MIVLLLVLSLGWSTPITRSIDEAGYDFLAVGKIDKDTDGYISREEFKGWLVGMPTLTEYYKGTQIEEMAQLIFEGVDKDHDARLGQQEYEGLYKLFA